MLGGLYSERVESGAAGASFNPFRVVPIFD